MKSVRPKSFDVRGMKLTPEEGFVLSRVDGPLSLRELVALTGLEEGRVAEIVSTLAAQGAVEVEGMASRPGPRPRPVGPKKPAAGAPEAELEELPQLEEVAELEELPQLEEVQDPAERADHGETASPDPEADEQDALADVGEREYRKLYERLYRPMERDARAAAAQTVDGGDLLALCFDPEPQIMLAILANPHAGLEHARAIALYHRTSAGLEICARRNEYLSDAMVQRRLLRNPQLPDTVLRRIIHPKMLLEVYKIAIDREIPERSRLKVRELFRKKFVLATADERAALIIKTEGRPFIYLFGCPLDAHTTTILCGKTTYTVLFVQNVARFSAAPPALLAHLLKQPIVRRNQALRKMILQHRNTPAEAKKNF